MVIVTGGAGFIGSNIIKALNNRGFTDILVVDHLKNGHKFSNLVDCQILDYLERDDFMSDLVGEQIDPKDIEVIFHQGACSATTEWDGSYMMKNNYEYSKQLLHFCINHNIPFIYASSAAVYGAGTEFAEVRENEAPLNVYGFSKWQFDQYVRRVMPSIKSQVVGLRYFNVYGPKEQHKGSMSSVAYHLHQQMLDHGKIKLFGEYDGYKAGEQVRDFVYVEDVANVNLWFAANPDKSGIFNCGTGRAQSFNDVAKAVLKWHGKDESHLEYVPFPDHLKGHYQSYTQADLIQLTKAGYDQPFKTVEEGVNAYLDWMGNAC